MSNSYYQFAVTIDDLSRQEMQWLADILKQKPGAAYLSDQLGPRYDPEQDFWELFPFFDYDISASGKSISFEAEEQGSLYQVAIILHSMMKKFKRGGFYKLTAAATCSRMLGDQFAGDTFWVTKDDILTSQEIESIVDAALLHNVDHTLHKHKFNILVKTREGKKK